jgi:hypothetical protein
MFEVMNAIPFPGTYKTKDSEDLDTLRQSFHSRYGTDPISIVRFLDFLMDIANENGDNAVTVPVERGEGRGQGGYGFDSD